jgi:hypothetical protein
MFWISPYRPASSSLSFVEMQVYIAMPDDTASRVGQWTQGAKNLTGATLGLPNHVDYLPLKDTKECAVDASMTGNAMKKVQMAREVTIWKVLEINVPLAAAFQMVHDGTLVRDINRNGWRCFGNLDYGNLDYQWCEVTMAPIGVDTWAKKTLMPTFRVTENAVCCKCQKQGAVWRMHCGDCWLDFLEEMQMQPVTIPCEPDADADADADAAL